MASLQIVNERLEMYYNAEKAILTSQSYSIGGKTLTRANLSDVQKTIKELEQEKKSLENKRSSRRIGRFVPMDW